jgi:hypothetical protein
MQIVIAPPPNFEAIKAVFPASTEEGVLFCYDGVIYNPSGIFVPRQIVAHEEVHEKQQKDIGVERWWERYIDWPEFRFHQELEAHIVEFHDFKSCFKNRGMRRDYLATIAKRLSGPLYGNSCTYAEAVRAIEQGRPIQTA